jgi:hypothetical protein
VSERGIAASDNMAMSDEMQREPPVSTDTVAKRPDEVERLLEALPAAPAVAVPGYEVLGELGRGGMGVVYKARDTMLDRLVALKVTLAGPHASPDARSRFDAEARAVARLRHPHIVQIFGEGEHDGRPYFVLEYLPAGSLAARLKGAPLRDRAAAALVAKLAEAVQHAHDHGIIHRDLKPANVLMSDDGEPKIADFGLAKWADDSGGSAPTQTGAILGTPSYMAPEQARGVGRGVGPAADVYALGVILYELLTGRVPFQGTTVAETCEMVATHTPVPPRRLQPKVGRDLEVICLKCLEKLPTDRYASAADLAADLRRYLGGEPIVARPLGALGRLVRVVGHNRFDASFRPWAWFAVALGAVVMVGCLAEVAARRADAPQVVQLVIARVTTLTTAGILLARCFGVRSALERQFIAVICGSFVGKYLVYTAVYGTPVPEYGTNAMPVAMTTYAMALFFLGTTHNGLFFALAVVYAALGLAMRSMTLDGAVAVHGLAWGATGAAIGAYLWLLRLESSSDSGRCRVN